MKIEKFTSLILLVILFNWGCGQSGEQKTQVNEQTPQKEQVKVPEQQKTQSGELDKFGRSPDEQHYGHNHASGEHPGQKNDAVQNPAQKPAPGQPDKFGRKPGEPHYGHNHE